MVVMQSGASAAAIPEDDDWDDDEEWEEDYDDSESSSFLDMELASKMKLAGAVGIVLLIILSSTIFTNFGFYSGAGSISVLIDVNEGKDASDNMFTFSILATSPAFGSLAKDGKYTITNVPNSVGYSGGSISALSGSFDLGDDGRGSVSIAYLDFFKMNGKYNVEVELGSQKSTDSVILNKYSESAVADLVQFDGSKPLDRDDGVITNMHFSSEVIDNPDSNLDIPVIIIPSVTGTITIYFSEELFEEGEDESYWDSDNGRQPEVVETIQFSYFGDQMSVVYESGASEEGPNFNPFIFDTSEFYGNSGDYAIVIEFTNDLGTDVTAKQGQSNWKWFHICNTNSDGTCSD
ncbi:MAG: hypothetical protein BEU01_00780 [Marine Group III euryarchaeote CG-Epi4]|uniref:Uncharacterized protein n=1 Tax=Marine Group III euryarchaeote CG-Epi4 TaxID=1888998 RepID=A0A1J5TWD3_9ARCH|nr:MAG: hypothetical protein BEU01_00780 [Marine Group III euryarchaeote CG-Epi4]